MTYFFFERCGNHVGEESISRAECFPEKLMKTFIEDMEYFAADVSCFSSDVPSDVSQNLVDIRMFGRKTFVTSS